MNNTTALVVRFNLSIYLNSFLFIRQKSIDYYNWLKDKLVDLTHDNKVSFEKYSYGSSFGTGTID